MHQFITDSWTDKETIESFTNDVRNTSMETTTSTSTEPKTSLGTSLIPSTTTLPGKSVQELIKELKSSEPCHSGFNLNKHRSRAYSDAVSKTKMLRRVISE